MVDHEGHGYREDASRYLYKKPNRYQKSYSRLKYIRTGLEQDGRFAGKARVEARSGIGATRRSTAARCSFGARLLAFLRITFLRINGAEG